MDIDFPYYSCGTIYGTVRDYNTDGVDIGTKDISAWGLFFTVKSKNATGGTRLIYKTNGNGITLSDGTSGYFNIILQSSDLNQTPNEYAWALFANEAGTAYSEGTTDVRWLGGGRFIVNEGVKIV